MFKLKAGKHGTGGNRGQRRVNDEGERQPACNNGYPLNHFREIRYNSIDLNLFAGVLALQLFFCFEVRALSGSLGSSTPEGPCDDMCGLDSLSSESDGDAADFLD